MFAQWKKPLTKWKATYWVGEHICKWYSSKELISKTYKELIPFNIKKKKTEPHGRNKIKYKSEGE